MAVVVHSLVGEERDEEERTEAKESR